MNKYQKELIQRQLTNEKEVLNDLKKIYKQAEKDIDDKIASLLARKDTENLQSIIYQVEYQKALKSQINSILDSLNSNQFDEISKYLTKSYEDGFIGTIYDIQKQGVPLIFPIDQEQVTIALVKDTKLSNGLYAALTEDMTELKKRVSSEISRGISQNYSYAQIAKNIRNQTGIGINKSMRIARTEGHRIQQAAAIDAQHKAKDAGADIVKQWDATLDGKTRPEHRMLDGQIRELDEPFEVNGNTAQYPGGFGIPSLDINCRCTVLQRARWAVEDETENTKFDNESGQLTKIESKNYSDFKAKYYETLDIKIAEAKRVKKANTFLQNLKSDKINTKIRKQKQSEHISGTNGRIRRIERDQAGNKTPSSEFFNNVDLEQLFNKYMGKGSLRFGTKQKYPVEYIDAEETVGLVWDVGKGKYVETKRFAVVYSKDGIHGYPVKEKGG